MRFGLRDDQIEEIVMVLRRFSDIESAKIFGSRARCDNKTASDIDIVLYGQLADSTAISVKAILEEETSLPYYFDVVDIQRLINERLKTEIELQGQEFFSAKAA